MPKKPPASSAERIVRADLPLWDHRTATAIGKMPPCPKCGEDKLMMTSSGYAFCNGCRIWVERSGDLKPE